MAHSKSYNLKVVYPKQRFSMPKSNTTTEVTMAAESSPVSIRLHRKPLAVLAQKIKDAGYLQNVRDIAAGKASTKFPRQLAVEVIHEVEGWHESGRCCLTCTHEVQQASARALSIIFGTAVAA